MRPEFGPPARLPAWGKALLGLALAAILVAVIVGGQGREHLVFEEADPQFNVLYDSEQLRSTRLGPGELMHLQGRRRGVLAEVVVSELELGPYEGDVSSGVLPIEAEVLIADAQAARPGFEVTDEGRARVNDAPGYQVGYRADGEVSGRDVLVVEGPQARRGYLLSLRIDGQPSRARELVRQARKAFRSFRFGTGRA